MLLENFNKLINNYGEGRKLKLAGFSVLSFFAGILEFVGIALIYPFILMIINPEAVQNSFIYTHIFKIININPMLNALLVGFCVLLIFIFKNIFIIFSMSLQFKFVTNWKRDLYKRFMEYYLYAPYNEILKTSASDKIYTITALCGQAIDLFAVRVLNLFTNAIIVSMIVLLLLWKFPLAAVTTIIFITSCLVIQNKYFKKRSEELIKNLAKEAHTYNEILLSNTNNIKELKILSAEKYFYDEFADSAARNANLSYQYSYFASVPPYIIEILIVTSLLILGGIISIQNIDNHASMIASFAVIAASIFRIAPALNRIQTSIININTGREFVRKLNEEYERCNLKNFKYTSSKSHEKLDFMKKIKLQNINFAYKEDKNIIKNVSLEIEKGDFIGIVGLSGAGKSTLADIILGLLIPQEGKIFVDNTELTEKNYSKFRHIIGYVPQQINMLDKTFKENVAWGLSHDEIDEKGVVKALEAAQIHDFVEEFSDGINAKPLIGTNGLSQGQKQRIAIARALYRDPEILILDEATSSLDVQIENEITAMLNQFRGSKTIIAIAHRLSTLKTCSKLIYMKDGRIVDIGTFEELAEKHSDFERLVKLSALK